MGRTSTPEGRLVSPAMVFFTAGHDVEHVASRDAQNLIDASCPLTATPASPANAIFHLGHITNHTQGWSCATSPPASPDVGDLRGNRIGVDVVVRKLCEMSSPEGQQRIGLRDRTGHIGGGKAHALARAWDQR